VRAARISALSSLALDREGAKVDAASTMRPVPIARRPRPTEVEGELAMTRPSLALIGVDQQARRPLEAASPCTLHADRYRDLSQHRLAVKAAVPQEPT